MNKKLDEAQYVDDALSNFKQVLAEFNRENKSDFKLKSVGRGLELRHGDDVIRKAGMISTSDVRDLVGVFHRVKQNYIGKSSGGIMGKIKRTMGIGRESQPSLATEDRILNDIALLKEEMKKVAVGLLSESIIPYTPESLREDYDPDDDYEDERYREQSEENYAELMSASGDSDDSEDATMNCGFAISCEDGQMMEEHMQQIFDESEEELDEFRPYFDPKTGKISREGWDILVDDELRYESNIMRWIQKKYKIKMSDEGHDNRDSLIGSCWVDTSDPESLDFVMERNEMDYAQYDAGPFQGELETEAEFFEGLSPLGKRLVTGNITFFSIPEDKWRAWDDAH